MQEEVIRRPLAKADGTNRSVRRPPRETLGGLSQAVIHPHCFGAGGLTVNNSFTVTGRIIPSHKNRPRRETRRSLPKANGGIVKQTTALIRGGGYRKPKFKSSSGALITPYPKSKADVSQADISINFRRIKI